MARKETNLILNLPPDVTVTKVDTVSHRFEITVSFPPQERVCPHCGSHACVIREFHRYGFIRFRSVEHV